MTEAARLREIIDGQISFLQKLRAELDEMEGAAPAPAQGAGRPDRILTSAEAVRISGGHLEKYPFTV